MKIITLVRYITTVRYLRFRQVVFRIYYACCSTKVKPIQTPQLRSWGSKSKWPSAMDSRLSGFEFYFENEKGNIEAPSIWNNQNYSKLWLYNLHYLDELNTVDADLRCDLLNTLIMRWIDENPPGHGVGWEPYPLSLRVVNLIKWYSRHPKVVQSEWLANLSLQGLFLSKRIEYHLLANHLFANAKALVFLGCYFKSMEANNWLKKGLKILDREMHEQFLGDGSHIELSPMYHAIMLWDLCDLVNLANVTGIPELTTKTDKWKVTIEKGLYWLLAMLHPDGDIPFFNDATFGIAPKFIELEKYAKQLGIDFHRKNNDSFSLQWLKESGYCAANLGEGNKILVDVAKIGPDYQPAHAHADTLSFELSLYGQRFLVNSGISKYTVSKERQYQRSTKAHNTVCIDNADSSEVWAGFRVAQRAVPKGLFIQNKPDQIIINCSHNGYVKLPGKNIHQREWEITKNTITISDKITGKFKEAEVRYYLHPDLKIKKLQFDEIECFFPTGRTAVIGISDAESVMIESSNWYPSFGIVRINYCLVAKFNNSELLTRIKW